MSHNAPHCKREMQFCTKFLNLSTQLQPYWTTYQKQKLNTRLLKTETQAVAALFTLLSGLAAVCASTCTHSNQSKTRAAGERPCCSPAEIVGSISTGGMDVCLLWVLWGRGLCDELITRPEDSYRLWCVVVCDLENLKNEEAMTRVGSQGHKQKNIYHSVVEISSA